ncbi:MAG: glycosyltransferase family 39 protein [candidate division WOR-3 bacterium]|nr:MAG: glycosyltransferase family 39 protein [candidate division WOR-3 bacterium]
MTRALLVSLSAFVVAIAVINPTGDFPLNDDWSYGSAVKGLVEQGVYRLSDWTAMPLLTQVMWGSLFCLPRGFSFTALRLSTLTMSLLALVCLLLMIRRTGESRPSILLAGGLCLLFDPVWLGLSNTFMTDVHFIALALLSLHLLAIGMESGRLSTLALGIASAVLATLIRQVGILIPVGFGLGYLTRHRPRPRDLLLALIFLSLTVAAYVLYSLLLASGPGLPAAYNAHFDRIVATLGSGLPAILGLVGQNLLTTLIYLGLFMLPLNLLLLGSMSRPRLALFFSVSLAVLVLFNLLNLTLPGNILTDRGLGPFTLARPEDFSSFSGSLVSRAVFGGLAFLGIGLLLESLRRIARSLHGNAVSVMLVAFLACYFLSFCLSRQFDRYMLGYLPLLVVLTVQALRGIKVRAWNRSVALTCAGLYGLFSVAATHDYLAWNRARWHALDHLTEELAVSPAEIDGGFEFNGWHGFSHEYQRAPGRSWWWVEDDAYKVALGPLPGYDTFKEYPTGTWLPGSVRRVYLLRKSGFRPPDDNPLRHVAAATAGLGPSGETGAGR